MIIEFLSEKDSKKIAELNEVKAPLSEEGYEDIFKPFPYIESDVTESVAYLEQIFTPASLRGNGFGTSMLKNWIDSLPESVTQIRLVAVDGVSGCTLEFYKSFGFKHAYTCLDGIDDVHTSRILTMGVNGNETVEAEELKKGQVAHYLFGVED